MLKKKTKPLNYWHQQALFWVIWYRHTNSVSSVPNPNKPWIECSNRLKWWITRSAMNEQRSINGRRRSACADVCEAVIWRIWQDSSEHGENGSGERGLAKCSYVSWNHRAAGKWINKYPLQPCCLFPCFGRAGKSQESSCCMNISKTNSSRPAPFLSTQSGETRRPRLYGNSKHAQLFRLRKWDQTNKVWDFNLDALWHT